MSATTGKFLFIVALIGASLVISASFYSRSRSADFDRHADVVAAIGRLRHLDERLSELVLAARFGLLNQYDSITETEKQLGEATRELRSRVTRVVQLDTELTETLRSVEDAAARQLQRVEHFKAENAVLKNSLRYLPTAAEDAAQALRQLPGSDGATDSLAVHRLVQAVLVHDLIGDLSTRDAYRTAFSELESRAIGLPWDARPALETLLAHAAVIGQKEEAVDAWVKEVFGSGDGERILAVEAAYHRHFARTVASSNRYRKILYAWSLLLLALASVAGLALRRSYANLERRVAERTSDLRGALDALWGEMRLASKIQQALVPASPELANCEIAASMRAIDAVGGDYYDLVHTRDADWVLIGDVSGHGVPAGLIMMMCHTAVRTLLRSDPGVLPDRLLVAVNGVLTENIRQLGEDKYMTISAFRLERDGTVLFAGAHQDIHISRAASSEVETIETSGIWLGLKAEIGDRMSTKRFRLAEGDVLLLHTDGVTEAVRDGEMFDTAGVRRVLREARDGTAEALVSAIFAALAGYSVTDDATILAIKHRGPSGRANMHGSKAEASETGAQTVAYAVGETAP